MIRSRAALLLLAVLVVGCGSGSTGSTAPSQGSAGGGAPSQASAGATAASQGSGSGSLTVTGALSGTVTGISSKGLGCPMNQGAVYGDLGSKSVSFDWGAITSGTTTSFPGHTDSTGGVSGGAYVLLNNLTDGGRWEATSGTLTIAGASPSLQVSVDVSMVRKTDGSEVQLKGSFTC